MAAQALEAIFFHGNDQRMLDHTPAAALTRGQIINLGSGLTGICNKTEGIAAGVKGAVATAGVWKIKKAESVVTFAVGAIVSWDDTNNTAVAAGSGDFEIGVCVEAAAATDNHVKTDLNREYVTQT